MVVVKGNQIEIRRPTAKERRKGKQVSIGADTEVEEKNLLHFRYALARVLWNVMQTETFHSNSMAIP